MRRLAPALLCAACSASEVQLAPPDLGGAASLVLAMFDGGASSVRAFDATAGDLSWSVDVDTLESAELYALVYDEPLASLELLSGEVETAAIPPHRELPPARSEHVATREADGTPVAWSTIASRPGHLAGLRVRGAPSPCARFAVEPLPIESAGSGTNDWGFVFPDPRGGVVAGTRRGDTYLFRPDGRAERVAGHPSMRPHASALDAEGRRWIGDASGEIWTGAPGSAPETWARTPETSPIGQIDALDVAPDGSELVALSSSGVVARRTANGAWSELHRLERSDSGTSGGVVRLGPDDVLAANAATTGVVRVRGGEVIVESTTARAAFTTLRRVEGVGIVAGSGLGELYLRRGEGWVSMGESNSGFYVLGIAPYQDGMIWGSPYGNMGQLAEGEFCPVFNPVTFFVRHLYSFGADVLILGEEYMPPVPKAAFLRRH